MYYREQRKRKTTDGVLRKGEKICEQHSLFSLLYIHMSVLLQVDFIARYT